jgi:hypothetical protein
VVAVATFLIALAVCRPFGNYPLNDDWQYARTARTFAASGRLIVDTPVGPSLVGQTLLAAPVIAAFGFSHTALRLLTIVLGAVGLWAADRLLRYAACPPGPRLGVLLLLALDPLYFYSSATFMTEIYGYVPVLLAAVLWFHARSRASPQGPAVGLGPALLVGGMMGAAFWTRQICVVFFGALAAGTGLRLAFDRDWGRLRRSIPPLICGAGVFAILVALYFPWARWSGNYTPQFSEPLGAMSSFDARAWILQSLIYLAYMSVLLAPLLILVRPGKVWAWTAAWAAALLLASVLGSEMVAARNVPELSMMAGLRRTFPYLPNVIFNAGIGPVTFVETTGEELPAWPHWPQAAARGIHIVAILAAALWAFLLPRLWTFLKGPRREAVEMFLFGSAAAALSFIATVQAFQMKVFDRYHLPGVVGGALALGAFLGADAGASGPLRRRWTRMVAFAIPWLALSFFTVAGLHDHFRWNDARWTLVNDWLAAGHSHWKVQGGYEVNGWLHYDAFIERRSPPPDIGPCCHCSEAGWYCLDDTYWVGMASPPGRTYEVVRSIWPDYWLARGHPVSLYERP